MKPTRRIRTANGTRYVIQGRDTNDQPAYYVVQVPSLKIALFEKALASPPLNLEQFGTITDSGFGFAPEDILEAR